MNKPVFFITVLVSLIIIFAVKSLFIGLAIMLGGTIMSVVLSNVSNSTFGIDDDDDEDFDDTPQYSSKNGSSGSED
ncbi:hypothetical protein [Candidatus Albibeggiatoa sp. nov. NOAA]|uniref:hypothetical protein n=1 Tax=Candidatus Albibeggiatoa sp. nov. NOAA TaxID=3162724 RepID=UPI0032FBFADE|nr:hypothetical protein [Thiotrichaceae bacterium]